MIKNVYIAIGSLLVLFIILIIGFSNNKATVTGRSIHNDKLLDNIDMGNLRHLILEVKGFYCSSCGSGVARLFSETEGVLIARVSRSEQRAEIVYDSTKINKESILNILHDPYSGEILADMPASQMMIDSVRALRND